MHFSRREAEREEGEEHEAQVVDNQSLDGQQPRRQGVADRAQAEIQRRAGAVGRAGARVESGRLEIKARRVVENAAEELRDVAHQLGDKQANERAHPKRQGHPPRRSSE